MNPQNLKLKGSFLSYDWRADRRHIAETLTMWCWGRVKWKLLNLEQRFIHEHLYSQGHVFGCAPQMAHHKYSYKNVTIIHFLFWHGSGIAPQTTLKVVNYQVSDVAERRKNCLNVFSAPQRFNGNNCSCFLSDIKIKKQNENKTPEMVG